MIRRNPTLIPMSDADVQDVRDMIARKKVDVAGAPAPALALAPSSATGDGSGSSKAKDALSPAVHVAAEEAKRRRDAMSRDERLGLQR